MKKNSILMFLGVIFALTLGFNHQVEAAEGESSLTDAEKDYLYGLNFSKVEVENMPYEELKFLVDSEAEILTSFEEIYSFDEVTSDPSEVTTFGDIPSADMSFKGNVLKLNNSTVSGYNAFYAHANFRWLNKPIFALTDKIAIGFPSSLGVYIPAQSGKLQGFNSTYSLYNTSTGGTTLMSSSTTPSTWDPSLGVAGSFDLSGTLNKFQTHEGTIAQTFYIKSSSSGKATVKFEYGHKKFTGTIGISVLPIGVSITPNQSNVDIRSYAASFSY